MSTALTLLARQSIEANDLAQLRIQFNQYPILSREDELLLAERVYRDGDISSAEQLILSHMRYVIKVVKSYLNYGLPVRDLVQEGTVGLMKAVKQFNPSKGFRLVSYASHWIKAEIHEYLLKNWRLVKVATTKEQRKLFFNLNKLKKKLSWLSVEESKEIAHALDVSEEQVQLMEQRLSVRDESFEPIVNAEEQWHNTPANYLSYDGDNPEIYLEQSQWQLHCQDKLFQALANLDERERMIVNARWLSEQKQSLATLSKELGISLERVRQLEQRAINKLQQLLS